MFRFEAIRLCVYIGLNKTGLPRLAASERGFRRKQGNSRLSGFKACLKSDIVSALSRETPNWIGKGRMSFAGTWMRRMSVAGSSCRDLVMRIAVVLALSVCLVSAIADPLPQLAVSADADDAGKMTFAFTPDLDRDEPSVPQVASKVPDFRFDDLRAERQASSHEWRVACAFEARGPPV